MERVRSLIRAAVGVAVLVAAPGCIVPPKADGTKAASPDPQAGPAGVPTPQKTDGHVKPASASMPAFQMPSLGKSAGKDKPGLPVTNVIVGWRKKIEYLPDPTPGKNWAMSPGLVGEVFLLAANGQFTTPEGALTVEVFDETPKPGADPRQGPRLGQWRFEKDVLKQLATTDERFGKCYALFLPWPDYRPDVVKVRLMVRYDPEHGFPLFAEPFSTAIDNGTSGVLQQSVGPRGGVAGGMPGLPPGLPPIVITRTPGQ
jgi:hypothetical protein